MQNEFIAGKLLLCSPGEKVMLTDTSYPIILQSDEKFIIIRSSGFNQFISLPALPSGSDGTNPGKVGAGKHIIVVGQIYSCKEKICGMILNNAYIELEGNFTIIEFTDTNDNPQLKMTNDKFGSRPLFYYFNNDVLIFSNHIRGIFLLAEKNDFPIARNSLIHFYHFGFTANDSTMFEGIKKIPSGHSLIIEGKTAKVYKYFDLLGYFKNASPDSLSEEYYQREINKAFEKSLAARTNRNKKVALGLSGGVDSGFIAKKLVEAGTEVTGINLSYSDFYNEHSRIDELSKKLGIGLIKINASAEDLISSFEESNNFGSEPVKFNDAAMWLVAKKAKDEGFDSLWDGDGADRLFFGMNRLMLYHRTFKYYECLKSLGLNNIFSFLIRVLPGKELKKLRLLFKNWNHGIPPYPERKLGSIAYNKILEKEIFELAVLRFWESYMMTIKQFSLINYLTYQSVSMCPEMFFYPPYELQKAMGIFPVSPYWDTEIVKLSFMVPASLKVKKGITKYILRKAAAFNDDPEYWMLPKIGLQNAFSYIMKTEKGKTWKAKVLKEISKSEFIEPLMEHLRSDKIDLHRLIPLYFWKKSITNYY